MDNVALYKGADLSERMKLLSSKPIFFDIAFSYLNYPELDEKKDNKKGGFWNKWNIFKK